MVGAGSGIGRESALALAAHGAEVVCADRDLAAAEETAAHARVHVGVRPRRARRRRRGRARREELGAVDVLVFTAATNVRKRILDYTGEEFDRVVSLNLRASFDLVRAFGAGMAERGRGSIIGFSSIRAVAVEPGQGVYAATKAGLVQLLRTAAAELGPSGVRLNAIAPGVVDTPLTAQIRATRRGAQAYADKSALGRWSRPDELAGAVVYLASDASSFVTGSAAPRRRRLDRDRRPLHPADLTDPSTQSVPSIRVNPFLPCPRVCPLSYQDFSSEDVCAVERTRTSSGSPRHAVGTEIVIVSAT